MSVAEPRPRALKRAFDLISATFGLLLLSPLLLPIMFLIWIYDFGSPFYRAPRVGKSGRQFPMTKFRSMVLDADKSGVDSTASSDSRITPVGRFVRRTKLDEIMQLWNVVWGDMSLVGPRPNVPSEVALNTKREMELLSVRPGITDMSSIVFADEGDILDEFDDPDLAYHQYIRPWKHRLGLLYVENSSVILDIKLILLTLLQLGSRARALRGVSNLVGRLSSDEELARVCLREEPLRAAAPPGAAHVVESRDQRVAEL
jgi:lipopolysaccharide/colanic/teichoic acid biosynthesis glycosyltransferase